MLTGLQQYGPTAAWNETTPAAATTAATGRCGIGTGSASTGEKLSWVLLTGIQQYGPTAAWNETTLAAATTVTVEAWTG